MSVYFMYLISICLSGLVLKTDFKYKKQLYIIIFFSLSFVLMGFRKMTIGTDTQSYIGIFENISTYRFDSIYFTEKSMYIYALYNLILSFISSDAQVLIMGNALVICLLSSIFLYKICGKHMFICSLLFILNYIFFQTFNTSRQYIAVLIIANGFAFICDDGKKIKNLLIFLILLITAFFVHNTAIIAVVLVPLIFCKNKKQSIIYGVSVCIMLVLLLMNSKTIVERFFSDYDSYYSLNSRYNVEQQSNGRLIILILSYFFFYFSFLIYESYRGIDFGEKHKFHGIVVIYLLFGLFSYNQILFNRFNNFFVMSIIYILPFFTEIFELKKDKFVINFSMVLIYTIPFYILLSGQYSGIIDYSFFWQ